MRWSNRALFKRVLIFYFQYNIVFLPIILKYLPDSICILIIQTGRRLESLNFVDSRKKLYNFVYLHRKLWGETEIIVASAQKHVF